jgi:hypothetical protein
MLIPGNAAAAGLRCQGIGAAGLSDHAIIKIRGNFFPISTTTNGPSWSYFQSRPGAKGCIAVGPDSDWLPFQVSARNLREISHFPTVFPKPYPGQDLEGITPMQLCRRKIMVFG